MGTISVNKLGGLALIIGPVLTVVLFFLQPGGAIIDAANPASAQETISAMVSNAGLSKLTSTLIPIGLLILLFGIVVVKENINKSGNGEALSRIGVLFILIGVIGWVISLGTSLAIAGSGLPAEQAVGTFASLYSSTLGIGTVAGLLAGIGFLALTLGVSTRDDYNKNFALVAAAFAVVVIVVTVIGGLDSDQLQTMTQITGICYVVHTAWMVTLGLNLIKGK